MGGGIISLVANGAQDVYLTGNPQITWFKVIYRRYTNFAMETIEQAIDSAKPGGRYSIQVQRNGDLATKSCLRIRVPAVTAQVFAGSADEFQKVAWVRRLGHALIRTIEVKIGGMQIDKHWGTWMDIFYELTHTSEEERGYRELIGDVPEMTTLTGPQTSNPNEVLLPEFTLYIPLQFWFCRNYGLALPLIALQYHEVRVEVELEDINKLICWCGAQAPNLSGFSFKDAGLMVDYVYLESAERRKYAQLGHEYLIEQLQFGGEETVYLNPSSATSSQKYKLNFNHPTKEIVWALKVGAFNGNGLSTSNMGSSRGRFLCYTQDDNGWQQALDDAAKNMAERCVCARFWGGCSTPCSLPDPPVPQTPNNTFRRIHGGHHKNLGQRVVVKVRNLADPAHKYNNVLVYAYNTPVVSSSASSFMLLGDTSGSVMTDLFDAVSSAVVMVYHKNGKDIRIECVEVRHSLSLTDVSVPVEDFDFDFRIKDNYSGDGYFSTLYCVHKDVAVIQPSNYGLRLDGAGNPVQAANLSLNGHDRFKVQEGSYFNYYQTRNHHTRTPADGINVYSFAIHPEKHQPSGTTNLSRIDSTMLNISFADSLRNNGNGIRLDLTIDTKLYIFAFSYNVLRVMSGMAGLAYSN